MTTEETDISAVPRVLLLTGRPGTGKTTIIRRALEETGIKAGGFYTQEIRQGQERVGFKIVTLNGRDAVLAHVTIKSPYRVSKYGVDLKALEQVGVKALEEAHQKTDLVVIDEIGKMELFSRLFREVALTIIVTGKRVLGTIMFEPDDWTDMVKEQSYVKVLTLTFSNREQVLKEVKEWLKSP